MVSPEYPPMQGGVGRYTKNLVDELRKTHDVYVVCSDKGDGDFYRLEPTNEYNSDILLGLVDSLHFDVVHVQYEPGLYGLKLSSINPKNTCTNIDSFYDKCKIPIVTIFHSAYTFRQWMNLVIRKRKKEIGNELCTYSDKIFSYWKHFINYESFSNLNRKKLKKSAAGIVFSNYLSKLITPDDNNDKCNVIYHGSSSSLSGLITKNEAIKRLCLPRIGRLNNDGYDTNSQNKKIALAFGFLTVTKGWDIFENIDIPPDWIIVLNHSKNYYCREIINQKNFQDNENIINLQKDFLSDHDLSLLMYAADAVILPYKVCSASGVMFDALAHGLPFVASDLDFFREFASQGLGITVKRNPDEFSKGLKRLERNYLYYTQNIDRFNKKLKWNFVANQHNLMYLSITNEKK
jgi:glycosyltransferase involved in cell wall biosynthesis